MSWLLHQLRLRFQQSSALTRAGVRNAADAAYRRERIAEQVARTENRGKTDIRELVSFLDQWIILEAESDGETTYIPKPTWDLESLLTRDGYPTYDLALDAVIAAGGEMRKTRRRAGALHA